MVPAEAAVSPLTGRSVAPSRSSPSSLVHTFKAFRITNDEGKIAGSLVNVGLAVVLAALGLIPPFAVPAATLVALPTAVAIATASALAPRGRARLGGGWRAALGREERR